MLKKINMFLLLSIGIITSLYMPAFAQSADNAFLIAANAKEGKVLNLQSWLAVIGFPAGELDGRTGPGTRETIKEYQKSLNQAQTGGLSAMWEGPLELAVRKKVQDKLKSMQLYDGSADGLKGDKTSSAIKKYAASKGLTVTDTLNATFLATLFNESALQNSIETTDTAVDVANVDILIMLIVQIMLI
ncbi:hypothetical protein AwWohl_10260 [Gammaproteobacteria bacterium]|nr:hypothetical protein AwWohl_10260 [Gammaproteobacteria bacterium]